MKSFFSYFFIFFLFSCSVSKNKGIDDLDSVTKIEKTDTITPPKPAVLNGKVITPSTNNTTIQTEKSRPQKL